MSQAAVMVAVVEKLRETFSLEADSCEVGFDGSPNPEAGEFYVGVHPLSWNALPQDWDLGEEYQVGVTLTMRMGFAPRDRWGIAVWLASPDGLEARIRRAITAIHHNQDVRIAACNKIDDGGGKILTPLQFVSVGNPILRDHTWFSGAPPESETQTAECGVSQTVIFGKCQRVQNIPDME